MDALEMLLNPEESVVEATYVYFFSYDSTPVALGYHVGDLEKTKVQFDHGVPNKVRISYHSWQSEHEWDDVTRMGGHPVVFNARGTHATYADQGVHAFDWTEMKELWDLWRDLDVIFPWDWIKEERVIHTDSNIDGANYLTHVWFWGNEGEGPVVGGESPRVDGPSGWLDKFSDRKSELESTGFACEGVDTARCPWPMGIFSSNKSLCQSGYFYSYVAQTCQQVTPLGMPKCSSKRSAA